MDDAKVQYIIELLKQGSGAQDATQDLKKLEEQGDKTTVSFEKLKAGAEKLVAFFGAEIVLKEAFNLFLEGERVSAKLEASLRSTGQQTDEFRKQISELVEELKGMTTFTGTELTNVIAKLVALGATKDSIRPLTNAVLDLSTLMDKDLGRATLAMGRAMRGEFGAFTEMGFHLDDTASTAQKLNSVLEQVGKTAGGQARAGINTLGGQMEQTKKQIEEIKESIGKMVAVSISGVASVFQQIGSMTVSQPMDQIKVNDRLRNQLELLINGLVEIGKLAPKAAMELREVMAFGFAGSDIMDQFGNTHHVRNPDAETAALRKVQSRVAPGTTSGKGSETAVAPPPVDVRNLAEEKAAMEEIAKLRDEMFSKTLQQYDAERLAVGVLYNERSAAIIKDANQGRLSEEAKLALEQQNTAALMADLEKVDRKRQELDDRRSMEEMAGALQRAQDMNDLSNQIVETQLRGQELERFQMLETHEKRMEQLRQRRFENEDDYNELMAKENQLYAAEQARYNQAHSFIGGFRLDMEQLGRTAQESFASGLSTAMVDAFTSGDQAFQKFAANFLKTIAQMILQALILRAIQSVFGGVGQASSKAAAGGFYPIMAAGGVAGVSDVSQATFFPSFNVIAGEAGREVMTVLARPQLMNFGGIVAQVGNSGPNKLAIVNAYALAGIGTRRMAAGGLAGPNAGFDALNTAPGSAGGNGDGTSIVQIALAPGLEASIIKRAVNGATVEVTQQLQKDSPLATAAKRLSA